MVLTTSNHSESSCIPVNQSTQPFGSGLVEVTALTALIGSDTAEQLMLGNRGAAGLAWVSMSTFGSLSLLRACVAAATPGWLRETLAVRNATQDGAIGLSLNLLSDYKDREDMARRNLGEAAGVMCERKKSWKPQLFRSLFSASTSDIQATKRDVYAFDQFSLSPLHSVGGFHPGTSRRPPIFIFQRDPLYEWPSTSRDWIELHLTLGKLLEVFILRRLNAGILAWVTALSWSYFFMSATLLQYMQLSRGYGRDLDNSGRLDIISGKLPTARRPGGECRILLGAPGNFRQHVVWRIVWTLGILISSVYIVSCYILLASRPPKVVYAWVGFQVLWLLCRSLFFHIAEGTDSFVRPTLLKCSWDDLTHGLKMRVLELIVALCMYQTHMHPRERKSYPEDVMDLDAIQSLLARCTLVDEYPLDIHLAAQPSCRSRITLDIRAIMGDTLLSSTAWFYGSKLTSLDVYDCCVIFIEIPTMPPNSVGVAPTNSLLTIPAISSQPVTQ